MRSTGERAWTMGAVLAWLVGGLIGGCAAPAPRPPGPSPPTVHQPAVVLFDGGEASAWRTLRGRSAVVDGAMRLNPGGTGRTVVVAPGGRWADGVVELAFRRPAGESNVPLTVSLRLKPALRWSAVYVICRPGRVELCRASHDRPHPKPERSGSLEGRPTVERWRIELAGPEITCYRQGRRVASFVDPAPQAGILALTADGGTVDVLSVRYRRIEPEPAPMWPPK